MSAGSQNTALSSRRKNAEKVLNKCVTVTIDRPLGSRHPKYDTVYPVNYGYVEGIIGGDGQEQDAYVLGVDKPLTEFSGKVVAVILRENDNEDKWVVVPEGMVINQSEILKAVEFQEKYYKTDWVSFYHKSCGVILYRKNNGRTEYLLLFQKGSRTWSFPKGHTEPDETETETAKRELFEETGLRAEIRDGFRETVSYPMKNGGRKYVVLYLAEAFGELRVKQDEILEYRFTSKAEALTLLPDVGYDKMLEKVENII